MKFLYRFLRYALFLAVMVAWMMPAMAQHPFTLTTADDITNGTQHYYLIKSIDRSTFYAIPHSNAEDSKVSTTSIPNATMRWCFVDAGSDSDHQYYYIVNSTGRCLYRKDAEHDGILIKKTYAELSSLSDDELNKYKFYLTQTGLDYYIQPKGFSGQYLNKRGGHVNYSDGYYIKSSTYSDSPSIWNFVAVGSVSWTPPFTVSTNVEKHYYKFPNVTNTSFYISNTGEWATVSNTDSDEDKWYFLEAGVDATYSNLHYYYIVNASTEKYLYYTEGTGNDVAKVKDYNSDEADKYRFLIVDAAYKPNNSNYATGYTIVPKLRQAYFYDKDSFAPMSMSDGSNLLLKSDRGTDNYDSHWGIEETSFVLVVAPTITNNFNGTISLSTTTPSAKIYYTTDDTAPSSSNGTLYESAFTLGDATVIKAITYNSDLTESSEVATYNVPKYTTPAITFDNSTSEVTITCTGASGIYYTTDGSTPNTSSNAYSEPFTVSTGVTIKAIATHAGYLASNVAELTVTQVATPTIQNNGSNAISITCATENATIYYTTDGNDPTTSSAEYTGPLTEGVSNVTIKAFAVKENMIDSGVGSGSIMLQCADPVIIKNSATTFTIECSYPTSDVTIYYNTGDGSQEDPTDESTVYTGEVTFNESDLPFTVKAIAYATNYNHSDVEPLTITQGHDYSQDYLTFNVITSGTIGWKSIGSGHTDVIQYSKNGGDWTSIAASSSPTTISVVANDKVRFKGTNSTYATDKNNYAGFEGGTAKFDIEGNIMSLLYGDSFADNSNLPNESYIFCSLFKKAKVVSAENLILPATTLKSYCYRALFSWCTTLEKAPALPATTLAQGCYWYMFEKCAIETAPDLLAATLLQECYGHMFEGCSSLNYIKCTAVDGFSATNALVNWVTGVASEGTFVKDVNATSWTTGESGIPTGWAENNCIADPVITCDGEFITITCQTAGASIYYRLGETGSSSLYSASIVINENTVVEAYAAKSGLLSKTVIKSCIAIKTHRFAGMEITPGPLYYGKNGFEIRDGWKYDSYNSRYGKTVGSTYFNFIELGQLFESPEFSTSDGDIDKILDPLDGWRVPTNTEWASILGTTRDGSEVNGSSNIHYAMIQLADVSGLLIFPDGETITGAELTYMDNSTSNTGITESELDNYLEQGCIFLPDSGYYDGSWNNGLYYWSSTENNSSTGYVSSGDNKDKRTCYLPVYLVKGAVDEATRLLKTWTYNGNEVEVPYSVNAIDGHSGSYARNTFYFTTDVKIRESQPTYLWFQHADQSADIYVDNVNVTTHWGGYTSFFVDLTDHVHVGTNIIKVALCNKKRDSLAPYTGDFNMNATLGEVKLISSPVVPSPDYGYDGFHITSTVTAEEATITVKTSVPTEATVTCSIKGDNCNFTNTQTDEGEITFSTTITNPHLWNGTLDPYLYDVTLTIAKDGVVYHQFKRGYGLRFYEYVVDTEHPENSRFKLNGSPYLLRGVCMHSDLEGKANALTAEDMDNDFEILKELGCNFVRLAHYPHPKEVYDHCDKMGIIVQTEAPCVNDFQSTLPRGYYNHLYIQYEDMVRQHFNHPCIMFWGLGNEIKTDNTSFAKTQLEDYRSFIKAIDSERWVGYVVDHGKNNPSSSFGDPEMDWFGCNIYVGWYISPDINDPTFQLNTRITNIITNKHKPLAFSEYGCGGTQHCHSDDYKSTTTTGNNPRHDIEYLMWLHEGHIAAIKNKPELLFTSQWQLFDIAVSGRTEGYKVCPDGGETVFDNNELKRLNNKGLVERDHKTKKDPFYLYKAWWNQTDKFVHICGKDYKKLNSRVIKCYTNDGSELTLFVNNNEIETVAVADNIAEFTARTFNPGDVVRVEGANSNDTFTFTNYSNDNVFTTAGNWNVAANWSGNAVPANGSDVVIMANATVPSGYTANAGNIDLFYGSLTITDGGQLVHSNEGVTATVQKDIEAYTVSQNQGEELTNGWYFIASPIADGYTPAGSMIANTYDLYRLNNTTWENYKNIASHPDFTTLNNGAGYLYANKYDVTLSFTGVIKPYTTASSAHQMDIAPGYNLIGNPYTFAVYIDKPYYSLNDERNIILPDVINNEPINPCTSVIVDGGENGVKVGFYKESQSSQAVNNGNILMTLAQTIATRGNSDVEILDKAIVSLNEGNQLGKFYFGTQDANIYIPQNGEEYAIAFSNRQGEIPLNFKANELGTYTISFAGDDMGLNGIYLIDILAQEETDLSVNPSYTFIGSPADRTARFKIVFKNNNNANDIFAYQSGSDIVVTGEGELQIFDVMGRLVFTQRINGVETMGSSSLQNGVYILKLNGKTQKIVVR